MGRKSAWEVRTGNGEEGLHGKLDQGSGMKDHMGSGYEGWSEGLGGVVDGDKSGFHLDAVSSDQHCPLYQIAYH